MFDHNLLMLRTFQNDGGPVPPGQGDEEQPARGNHDGGVVRFGPDGKLYVVIGDSGRRGQLQNLVDGPGGPTRQDDQFGGPEPDPDHLTGVILRLNDDGSTPEDNPFFAAGAEMGGPEGEAVQRMYAYGLRNCFGMAFDPKSGELWEQENGDDSFSEINRVSPGFNSGWTQIMGPPERIAQFKAIETTVTPSPPDPFADDVLRAAAAALVARQHRRLACRSAVAALHAAGSALQRAGVLVEIRSRAGRHWLCRRTRRSGRSSMAICLSRRARPFLEGGHLFRFNITGNRRSVGVDDPRLNDRVADNLHKWEITESESLLIGRNFGVGTDVQTGPNGHLYVVSLSNGAIYEIAGRR